MIRVMISFTYRCVNIFKNEMLKALSDHELHKQSCFSSIRMIIFKIILKKTKTTFNKSTLISIFQRRNLTKIQKNRFFVESNRQIQSIDYYHDYDVFNQIYIQKVYNNFLLDKQQTHMELSFDLQNQHPLFHCVEDIVNYSNQIDRLEERDGIDASLPLFRYNSEIEEIMKRFTFESPIAIIKPTQTQIQSLQDKNIENFQKTPHEFSIKKQKKIKKVQNSPFHNYQKHLNNALKKLIIVPEFQTHDELYKIIASQIWTVYCRCEIKTKRILHYVFNERNEHVINEPELRTYRLWNIYHSHSQQLISQAKNFLSKLAIDQLDPQNIEGYLKTRKLKSKLGFKQYLLGFRNELQKGYLKRRINGQKLIHDQ